MQYKREEVRDMNLYGEILKKLEGTPCLALERSFVGEEGNLADMRCELREGAEASEIGKEALTQGQPVCGRAGSSWKVAEPFFPKSACYSREAASGSSGGELQRASDSW